MNPLITNVMILCGISFFREKFSPYIRPTRESSSADDRIKKFQRVLTLFQVLIFTSAAYTRPPNAGLCSRDWTGWSSTIANFSGLAGQILMEIILGISAQMLVMYDHHNDRGNDVSEAVRSLREELNITYDALLRERYKKGVPFSQDKKELLSKLREKIEENSESIKEGDYIIMMDLLKELYLNNE